MKVNVERMRRQATGGEKVFAKDTFYNGLLNQIHKALLILSKKTT